MFCTFYCSKASEKKVISTRGTYRFCLHKCSRHVEAWWKRKPNWSKALGYWENIDRIYVNLALRVLDVRFVDNMSQIEENKQVDEVLENTNLNYTHSPIGEQQGFLDMFGNFSTTTYNAMGTPRTAPQSGPEMWEIAFPGIGLVPGVLSPSPPNWGHHGLTNPHRTAFYGPTARCSFQRLALHTIHYCSNCFLLVSRRNSHVREGCE